jgi:putative flavoprotein involved in K+ transport
LTTRVTAVVIGAGHAGLAASRFLTGRSIDHVVLERGEVANSWRRERWDSLRLLTPNFQSRLPGHRYDGPDPDGYMTMGEVIDFISRYAKVSRAPVRTNTNVTSLKRTDDEYHVTTSDGDYRCRCVVIASGACNLPSVPRLRDAVPESIEQFTPSNYRNPAQLPDGGVIVVGPSATGVQLAAEIHRSGRPVTLSVGEHVRLPRTYRGRDVLWWMESSGVWDERYDAIDDLTRARRLPSPQLVGTPERATLDLNTLSSMGVELVGRLAAMRDGRALFSGGLRNLFALADLKMERLLDTFDNWARTRTSSVRLPPSRKASADHCSLGEGGQADWGSDFGNPERFEPTHVPESSRLQIDLRSGEVRSIVWATGFRPDYSWMHVPVVDEKGHLRHEGGLVSSPGMYALGLPVLRRRKSSFIHGAEEDAREVIDHLTAYLAG